jgi:acyl-CoA synthetase (AMP-forming)/AMP-acid ligase II
MAPETSSLTRLLDTQVRRGATRPAVWDVGRGRRLSYGRLRRLLDDWHAFWDQNGVKPGDRALLLGDGVEFVVAYLSGLTYGLTLVPVNPDAPDQELRRWVAQLRPSLAVTGPDQAAWGLPTTVVEAPDRLAWRDGLETEWIPVRDRPGGAVILPTSGLTGEPKAVRLDMDRLLYAAQAVAAHHALTTRDRGFSPLPLFQVDGEVAGLLAQLLSGGTVLLDRGFHDFVDIVHDTAPTWINAVPAVLATLAADRRLSLPPSVRFVRSAAAPLPVAVLKQFEARVGPLVLETYGVTEAAGQVAANPLSPRLRRAGSVGRPVATRIRIVDDQGAALGVNQVGMVAVSGPQVVTRYLADEANRSGLDPAWLLTGDQGFRDVEGYLYLVGRTTNPIHDPLALGNIQRSDPQQRELQPLGQP